MDQQLCGALRCWDSYAVTCLLTGIGKRDCYDQNPIVSSGIIRIQSTVCILSWFAASAEFGSCATGPRFSTAVHGCVASGTSLHVSVRDQIVVRLPDAKCAAVRCVQVSKLYGHWPSSCPCAPSAGGDDVWSLDFVFSQVLLVDFLPNQSIKVHQYVCMMNLSAMFKLIPF